MVSKREGRQVPYILLRGGRFVFREGGQVYLYYSGVAE